MPTKRDVDLSGRVLQACNPHPQTMAQLCSGEVVAGDPTLIRFAVYNLVRRGTLRNLNAGRGRGFSGLFLAVDVPDVRPGELPVSDPRADGARELERAWFGRA